MFSDISDYFRRLVGTGTQRPDGTTSAYCAGPVKLEERKKKERSDYLISAVRKGKRKRVKELINSSDRSLSLSPLDGYILLLEANENNHTEIAKFLLTNITDIGSIDVPSKPSTSTDVRDTQKEGNTLLLSTLLVITAVNCDNIEIVDMLLNKNPSVSETLLFAAIRKHRTDIVTLLLNRGFDIDVSGQGGITPLQFTIINKILFNEPLSNCGVEVKVTSSGATLLVDEITNGFSDVVKMLLSKTPYFTCIAKRRYIPYIRCTDYIPLHVAIEIGNAKMVKLLLSRGGNVHARQYSTNALKLAVLKLREASNEKERVMIMAYIAMSHIDLDNNNNRISVLEAVEASEREYVDILSDFIHAYEPKRFFYECEILRWYISNEIRYILSTCCSDSDCEILLTLVLFAAIEKGYSKVVRDLFDCGLDAKVLYNRLSIKGFTLLHSAVNSKQVSMVKLFLSYGADINAKGRNLRYNMMFDKEPIYYAIKNSDARITALLLRCGADITNSPHLLNTAVMKASKDIVNILLQHSDTDVNAKDDCGNTALHFNALLEQKIMFVNDKISIDCDHDSNACISTKADIAELLISKGASSVNTCNNRGQTPLHTVAEKGYAEVVKVLLKHNADVTAVDNEGATPLSVAFAGDSSNCFKSFDILRHHIVKMRVVNLYVSEKNVQALTYVSDELSFFHKECEKEIEKMKSEKIGGNVSFYDIATRNAHQLAIHPRFTSIAETLATGDYMQRFPIYFDWIEENFKRGQEREVLLISGVNSLYSMLGFGIPDVLTVDVFSFLSNDDLRNLVKASDYNRTRHISRSYC